MGVTFSAAPAAYGGLHLAALGLILLLSALLFPILKKQPEEKLLRLLGILGAGMLVTEVWKQWFVFRCVYGGALSTWFFPWQLCSMAMYLSFLCPFLKGRAQDTALAFLGSFSLLAAVFALVFPGDMLRPQVLLFCHSFLSHGVMVLESLAAILILRRRKRPPFRPVLLLYLGMAAVAKGINIVSHYIIEDRKLASNMFNITPYYPSTQPVFHGVALRLGILPEIVIYLGLIALGSWGLFRLVCTGKPRAEREACNNQNRVR